MGKHNRILKDKIISELLDEIKKEGTKKERKILALREKLKELIKEEEEKVKELKRGVISERLFENSSKGMKRWEYTLIYKNEELLSLWRKLQSLKAKRKRYQNEILKEIIEEGKRNGIGWWKIYKKLVAYGIKVSAERIKSLYYGKEEIEYNEMKEEENGIREEMKNDEIEIREEKMEDGVKEKEIKRKGEEMEKKERDKTETELREIEETLKRLKRTPIHEWNLEELEKIPETERKKLVLKVIWDFPNADWIRLKNRKDYKRLGFDVEEWRAILQTVISFFEFKKENPHLTEDELERWKRKKIEVLLPYIKGVRKEELT